MQIVRDLVDLRPAQKPACLALGFFDGVHLGHQQVIRQTINDALGVEGHSLVVTFDAHPSTVVQPTAVPPLIYSLEQRIQAVAELGAETLLLLRFDQAFSRLPAEVFIENLVRHAGKVHIICVGANFVFGHKRGGNVDLLRTLGQRLGFAVHGLAAVSLDGEIVSSTRIRDQIQAGNLDQASQMLGRAYSIAGKVISGDKLGRQIGVPTANLDIAGRALPPNGVYAAHAKTPFGRYRAVVNIGYRPTVQPETLEKRVEAHLLDFQGQLYGLDIELTFIGRLRAETRFGSLEQLKQQIRKDIQAAQALF